MQEIRRIVVVALFLLLTFTAGCSDSKFSPSEKFIADNTLVGEIKENMTMKEVIQSLGKGGYNTTGKEYPYCYTWDLSDGSKLEIVFEGSDYEQFWEKYHNREFVLPEENGGDSNNGIHIATPNEQKVLKEWIQNTKAVYATIAIPEKGAIVLF